MKLNHIAGNLLFGLMKGIVMELDGGFRTRIACIRILLQANACQMLHEQVMHAE